MLLLFNKDSHKDYFHSKDGMYNNKIANTRNHNNPVDIIDIIVFSRTVFSHVAAACAARRDGEVKVKLKI